MFKLDKPVMNWKHIGQAIDRGSINTYDADVTGDPCIVWDEEIESWRMFYFAQKRDNEEKEMNSIAHATNPDIEFPGTGHWQKEGPVKYTNPDVVGSGAHKPWILMDPYKPNRAVKIDNQYILFSVTYIEDNKVIHIGRSPSLNGPWTMNPDPILNRGGKGDFDDYHVDTITAYWFEERKKILLFYKGYPSEAQSDQPYSPYGSSTAAALIDPLNNKVVKLGKIIIPSNESFMSGWISTPQLFPADKGGWYGLITGSPSAPDSIEKEPHMREPAPSLGGWAYTPEEFPISGWKLLSDPITTLENIPMEAKEWGETVNLWRHHILVLTDGSLRLYYNSGAYGNERMFCRKGSSIVPKKEN